MSLKSRNQALCAVPREKPNKFLKKAPHVIVGSLLPLVASAVGLDRNDANVVSLTQKVIGGQFASAVELAEFHSAQKYQSASDHFAWNQLSLLIRKVPFKDPKLQPRKTAVKKFIAAEEACGSVNRRGFSSPFYHSAINVARRWIEKVIGLEPNVKAIMKECDFGGGSSVGVGGERTHLAAKLKGRWTVTPAAAPYALRALMSNHQIYRWASSEVHQSKGEIFCLDHQVVADSLLRRFEYIGYNNIDFVAKTAKTHRAIAVEPTLNGFLQKGVDTYLKRKLKRHGINLTSQEFNKFLARLGSEQEVRGFEDPIVTLDLSAASDTVAIAIVKELFPPAWFDFLNALRSPSYKLNGQVKRYEKFCSMGNGFCFPVETLIFSALAVACDAGRYENGAPAPFHVFGDDIILRRRAALRLVPLLELCGFQLNADKSFIWGPFRESCGADWFAGVNVRPYTLDFLPVTHRDAFKVSNGLLRAGITSDEVHRFLHSVVHEDKRFMRPIDGPDDTAFTVPLDTFMGSKFAEWNRDYSWWEWRESLSHPRFDTVDFDPWIDSAMVARGGRSLDNGRPGYTLRQLS